MTYRCLQIIIVLPPAKHTHLCPVWYIISQYATSIPHVERSSSRERHKQSTLYLCREQEAMQLASLSFTAVAAMRRNDEKLAIRSDDDA